MNEKKTEFGSRQANESGLSSGGRALDAVLEFFRKLVVSIKHKPQTIPLLILAATCMFFTFNLSPHSRTIKFALPITDKATAICFFIVTLASFMDIVSFIGYKKFDLKGIVAFCITLAMLALQIGLQAFYYYTANNALKDPSNDTSRMPYINTSLTWTMVHIVFLGISVLAVALLPLYSKLLMKINTTPKSQIALGAVVAGELDLDEEV